MLPARYLAMCLVMVLAAVCRGQEGAAKEVEKKLEASAAGAASVKEACITATSFLLGHEEGKGEWPYEGVYRVRGQIPIGYRIGGTAICGSAMLNSPDYAENAAAQEAVGRAIGFVVSGIEHPLMSSEQYDGGYDVRGWGYTYGLALLLECKEAEVIAAEKQEEVEKAIAFYLQGIAETEIPQVGGWNYARPPGKEKVAPPSPFMTAPTLLALYRAKGMGYEVDEEMVGRALKYLESARLASGAVAYSGEARQRREGVPGASGRMLATETALYLAGRSSEAHVRGALDAFIVHWEWLEKRRARPGTHEAPYGVAPYYFYFAHYWAAQAVELLPEHERGEYRRRVRELVMKTRDEDGSWNDRVFPRSACYGTAMASLALRMPELRPPARWEGGRGRSPRDR